MPIQNHLKISKFLSRRLMTPASRLFTVSLLASISLVGLNVFPAGASTNVSKSLKADTAAKLKDDLAQAQKDASSAATRYSNAYGELEKLNDELAETQNRLSGAEGTISELQVKASTQAKNSYIRMSEGLGNESYEKKVDETRREKLLSIVSEFDDAQKTTLVSLKEDLQIAKDELTSIQKDKKDTVSTLASEKKTLDAKLAAATKAKSDLDAKLAKEAKEAKANAKKAVTAVIPRSSGVANNGSAGTIINPGSGSIACPIAGATAFTNDWANPRSGGRTHKGTDIFSPRGTPNVAVVSGTVFFQNEGTGGISAYVTGGGNTYYYTHLSSTVGGGRNVSRGEVIGYTGNSGNAAGGATHTHFEIRQGGPNGNRVNPYATLRSVC